jgi:soluble lytic murein transglycosylase-like protein
VRAALLVTVPSLAAWAQTNATAQPSSEAIQAGMAKALTEQRASVLKQVTSVMGKPAVPAASFFTVPWVESALPFNLPPCDPLPSTQLDQLIESSSKEQGVKPDLIRAVINEESGGRPCAVSSKGAQGLMQLMPATANELGVKDPFDPRQNVNAGTQLLKQLLTKYSGDISLALSAYNAGQERVDRDGKVPEITETKNYVTDIMTKLPQK